MIIILFNKISIVKKLNKFIILYISLNKMRNKAFVGVIKITIQDEIPNPHFLVHLFTGRLSWLGGMLRRKAFLPVRAVQ